MISLVPNISFAQGGEIEKGTISFAISSENLFSYASSIFSSDTPNQHLFDFANGDSLISLKYFYEDKKAVRIAMGVNFKSDKNDEIIQAFNDDGDLIPGEVVRNIFISEYFRIGVKLGLENNYSYKKWRYYHGFDFSFSFQTGRNRLINGNPLPQYLGAVLDSKAGTDFSLGPDLIGGFEYMFMANMSIGIELNWGARYLSNNFGDQIVVEENEQGQSVEVFYEGYNEKSQFAVDNIPGARIKALIYLTKK